MANEVSFAEAGVGGDSDALSAEQLRAIIAREEQTLRDQYPAGKLPAAWEKDLAALTGEGLTAVLRRFATVKHMYWCHMEGLQRQEASSEQDRELAMHQLLARTPVRVRLSSGRFVSVTGRSQAALVEMAAHEMRMQLLGQQIQDAAALLQEITDARTQATGIRRRRALRRRWRRVQEIQRGLYQALLQHRAAWAAHLTTPDGAPASEHTSPPAWWRELAVEDSARLLMALHESGPGRYARLGERPARPIGKDAPELEESFGAATILAGWGIRMKILPAELVGRDYGQMLAEMRAAPRTADSLEDQE